VRIGPGFGDRRCQRLLDGVAQCVDGGIVDGDDANAPDGLGTDGRCGHELTRIPFSDSGRYADERGTGNAAEQGAVAESALQVLPRDERMLTGQGFGPRALASLDRVD